jgi:hypothetical protein
MKFLIPSKPTTKEYRYNVQFNTACWSCTG